MNNAALILLQLHRSQMTKVERQRSRNLRLPKTLYPIAIEEVYAQEISKLQKMVVSRVHTVLSRIMPLLIDRTDMRYRKDTAEEDYEELQKELAVIIALMYGTSLTSSAEMSGILSNVSKKTRMFLEANFSKQFQAVAGVPWNTGMPNWTGIVEAWQNTNYILIKSLSEEYIAKLNTLLLTGIQSGWTTSEMAEEIMKLSDKITGFRANLIARDQIGKLNSKITESLHASLGLDEYTWNTARDEKVRGKPGGRYPKAIPSHWIMEGLLCKWSDSTVYSDDGGRTWKPRTAEMPQVAPGMEILCRCMAAISLTGTIRYVDQKIEGRD